MAKIKKILITPSEAVYSKIKAEATKQKRSVTNYIDAVISNLYKEADIVDINAINNVVNKDNIDIFSDSSYKHEGDPR